MLWEQRAQTGYSKEEFDDTKGVIRIRKSMKNRKHNDLQNITHKTKDQETRT
jgi:hypothetical protein